MAEGINVDYEGYDPKLENSLDVVVQHMKAAGFTDTEIIGMINVSEDFVKEVCTPSM